MRFVALRHWKSLAAKYTRKASVRNLDAVERVFETRYKQENISDVTKRIVFTKKQNDVLSQYNSI